MTASRDLRRGFRRLALVAWVAGLLALAAGFLAWQGDPFTNVCATEAAVDHASCLAPTPAPDPDATFLERLRRAIAPPPPPVDPDAVLPRHRTPAFARAGRLALALAAVWTAVVWGGVHVALWVAAGFRARPRR